MNQKEVIKMGPGAVIDLDAEKTAPEEVPERSDKTITLEPGALIVFDG